MKSLLAWCLENDAKALLECYQGGQNPIPADKIPFSSIQEVNWLCPDCGMGWKKDLNHATRRKGIRPCAYCSREKASYMYNAATEYPELELYWDEEENREPLTAYLPSSHFVGRWRCPKGHRWERAVKEQTQLARRRRSGSGEEDGSLCLYCNGERVSNGYNLEDLFPDVAMQWNYSKNGTATPRNTHPYSHQSVSWICPFNPCHVWQDRVSNRTMLLRGCPVCSREAHISYAARALLYYLRQNHVPCACEKQVGRYSIDIAILSGTAVPIALELDGLYMHSSEKAQQRDARKDAALGSAGYRVVRVKEAREAPQSCSFEEDVLKYPFSERHQYLDQMIQVLMDRLLGICVQPNHKEDHWKIERMYYHDRKTRSLAVQYPELAKQWSGENEDSPDVVLPGSNRKRRWKCPDCGRTYEAVITNRVKQGSGCPYCAHLRVTEQTSLAFVRPDLADQWHWEKNAPLRPEEVLPGTDRRVWWICEKGHEWLASVSSRTAPRGSGCPVCNNHAVIPATSLAAQNPTLAAFFDLERNQKSPWETAKKSNKFFWWRCPKGHVWEDSPNKLSRFPGDRICPYCSGRKQ